MKNPEHVDLEQVRDNMRCQNVCATHTDVPRYVHLIAQGKFEDAYDLIRETNPFPSICGRVCHHPCETHCLRAEIDAPVAIDALKRFVSDYVVKKGRKVPVRQIEPAKKEKVAVVGAGPAGLTAAHDLARLGYMTEVYEREDSPGGVLMVGIPEYRLPKKVVNFEIDHIRDYGVKINTGVNVGADVSFEDLRGRFDAVLIAVGAHVAGGLSLPGEKECKRIFDCIDFLKRANRGEKPDLGDSVAVIGGGFTAVDCARMALRLGAKATVIYRRTRREMTALPRDITEAEREGMKVIHLADPVRINALQDTVKGLVCIRMKLGEPDEAGRRCLVPVENSEFIVDADSIIPAANLSPDLGFLEGKLSVTSRNALDADPQTLLTSEKGIFVAGDAVLGPSTVIDSIASGHRAANSIHWYLSGHPERIGKVDETVEITEVQKVELAENYDSITRHPMPKLPLRTRMGVFDEIELGFTEEMAINEAKRCLRCDHSIYIQGEECILCGKCSEVCPYECIQMVNTDGKVSWDSHQFFEGTVKMKKDALCIRCNLCREYCPIDAVSFRKATWKKKAPK